MASATGQVVSAGAVGLSLATVGWTWEGMPGRLREEGLRFSAGFHSAAATRRAGAQEEATRAFLSALSARSPVTAQHSARVGRYAGLMASALGLRGPEARHVRRCGLLHDVGKLGIAEDVLEKPGPLSPGEWAQMKLHPEIGARMLQSCTSLQEVLHAVALHHERVDGTGYPDGVSGCDIPLEARIVSVCDAYDTITSDRPYRKALGTMEAIARLLQAAGTQFDADLTRLFCLQVLPLLPVRNRTQAEETALAD